MTPLACKYAQIALSITGLLWFVACFGWSFGIEAAIAAAISGAFMYSYGLYDGRCR